MYKRRPEDHDRHTVAATATAPVHSDDRGDQTIIPTEAQQNSSCNKYTSEENSYSMFQRLIKRFKRHHTPPSSPAPAISRTPEKERREKRAKSPAPGEEESNDDAAGSVHSNASSHSSSYSDYDYLESTGGGNPHHQRTHSNDFSADSNGTMSSDDDDDDSSYSDYDDYQFLTAVAAAARRKSSMVAANQTSASPVKDEKPLPTEIITSPTAETAEDEESKDSKETATTTPTAKSESSGAIVQEDLEALARTHFPDFFSDSEAGVPGAILSDGTESSSDEEEDAAIERKSQKYRTKEDEDVAVFMNLAKRMSLKSLLHLLKGHVQSQRDEYSAEYMRVYNNALKHYPSSGDLSSSSLSSILTTDDDDDLAEDSADEKAVTQDPAEEDDEDSPEIDVKKANQKKHSPKKHHHHRKKKSLPKKKCFRWAEVTGDKIRTVVHEVESVKTCTDLWWQPQEMHNIRADLIETVKFYRKRRPSYIQSVEIVARHAGELANANPSSQASPPRAQTAAATSNKEAVAQSFNHQQQVLEDHMKSLMSAEHSYARGLETHIVKMLSDHRKSTVSAVLEEQRECKICNDDYDTTAHCLREQSTAYSSMSAKFSVAMARCDQIDALKASMSAWQQGSIR